MSRCVLCGSRKNSSATVDRVDVISDNTNRLSEKSKRPIGERKGYCLPTLTVKPPLTVFVAGAARSVVESF